MPGRDYTRAFELFQLSLDDGYHWKPHADGLRGLAGLQTLPGDLWKQSLMDNQEDDLVQQPRLEARVFRLDTTGHTRTASPSFEQSYSTFNAKNEKSTTKPNKAEPSKHILQLPTPDTTPSSSGELFRPHMPNGNLSSSHTASFMTARETSVTPTPYSITRKPLRVDTSNNTRSDATNTRRRIDGLVSPNSPIPNINSVPTGSPKHVKAKSRGQKSLRADLEGVEDETQTEADDENDDVPVLMRGLSMRNVNRGDRDLVPQASIRTLQHTPPPRYHLPGMHESDVKPSHAWTGSSNPEVIEALVVDTTPPRRKRKLRHAAGDGDLRDTVSQSEHSNRTSYSDTSLSAVKMLQQVELPSQLPTVLSLDYVGAGDTASPALRHTGKFEPVESKPGPSSELHPQIMETPLTISYSPSLLHQLESRRFNKDDTIAARASALPRDDSSVQEMHIPSADGASQSRNPSEGLGIANLSEPEKMWTPEEIGFLQRRGSHQSMVRRPSDVPSQHSSVGSTHFHGVHPQSSPVSFNSEGGHTPYLDEATAINLYPHNNASLLLVQETSLSRSNTQVSSLLGKGRYYARPVITVDVPKGNVEHSRELDDDTGSVIHHETSAHAHPTPPILTLIPASPATGRNSAALGLQLDPLDLEDPVTTSESPPKRSSSLLKRARAYSDNVVQPFLTRTLSSTGSVRRTLSRRRRSEIRSKRISAPQPIDNPEELAQQEKLHPFWQPRDAWEGIDDDSEEGIVGVAAYERDMRMSTTFHGDIAAVANDPTPREVIPASVPSRRIGSLRFLIGNTLGIDRQPTNRRLQMVRWPTGRRQKGTPRTTRAYIRPVQDDRTALPPGLEYATAPSGVFVERYDLRKRDGDVEDIRDALMGKFQRRVGEGDGDEERGRARRRRRGGRRRLGCGLGR